MPYAQPQVWYTHAGDGSTTGYYAVPQYSNKAWTAGQRVRPLTTPAVGNERVYVCTIAGTSTVEPTWTFTKGAAQNATGATFTECTGEPGVNGDLTNALQWTASSTPALGRVIYDPTSNTIQICTVTAAGAASKPTFSATAGVVTSDGATCKWTSLGPPSSFPAFAAPHARLTSAFTANWGAAGNDYFIADNSAETSTVLLSFNNGTVTAPSRVFSVDRTTFALKPGAAVTCSFVGANAISVCSGAGGVCMYWYGVAFACTGAFVGAPLAMGNSGIGAVLVCEACSFQLGGAAISGGIITIGGGSQNNAQVDLVNCTLGFNNIGQTCALGGANLTWRNTPHPFLVAGSTVPSALFRFFPANPGVHLLEGIDFTSMVGSVLFSNAFSGDLQTTLKNCKMHSTTNVIASILATQPVINIDLVNCDIGTNITRNERYNLHGTLLTSTTVTRTGGATDGTTPVSHAVVATAFARSWKPFNALPLMIWNDVVGTSRTVTLYGVVLGTTSLPFNDQFWFDVQYMGSSGSPVASVVSNGLANPFATHAVVAVTDGSTWSGAGGTNAPFALTATFTAQQKGYVTIYPRAGASYSVNLDPKPVLT